MLILASAKWSINDPHFTLARISREARQVGSTAWASIAPAILLHFHHPWRSCSGPASRRYACMDASGRVESGTETESTKSRRL